MAALLAPVRYLPERLGIYRIHGSNLCAVNQRRIEEADSAYEAARHVSLLKEKVAHANEVLRRAGRPVRLSPFLRYAYVERYCRVHSLSLLSCLPAVLRAVLTTNGLGLRQAVGSGLGIAGRVVKHYLRQALQAE